jgi:hypothetical protein
MQPPQALANGASQEPEYLADRGTPPLPAIFSLTLLPTAERFSRVPGMLNSSEVKVLYPT